MGGGHGVWNKQVGSQKWLPPPNAVVRLNSDSPCRRDLTVSGPGRARRRRWVDILQGPDLYTRVQTRQNENPSIITNICIMRASLSWTNRYWPGPDLSYSVNSHKSEDKLKIWKAFHIMLARSIWVSHRDRESIARSRVVKYGRDDVERQTHPRLPNFW